MTNQRRLTPSTSMLTAFESAARNGSFTGAAQELSLTQGAISRQVKALEELLGVILFKRNSRAIALSDAGKTYAKEIHLALQIIRDASLNAMSHPLVNTLNLAILPTFGTRWLMPRFPDFLKLNPSITVNFVTKLAPFDFESEDIHAAIHYGEPDWPKTNSTFLMSEQVIPVCSPKLFAQHKPQCPADLSTLPLLHLASRSDAWDNWFSLNKTAPPKHYGMHFEQFSFIAQATVAGLGVALLPKFLIQSELDRGELAVILDIPLKSSSGYHLVTPIDKSAYPPVAQFRDWLLSVL